MPSPRLLRGIAHDIAHHSQSALSCLHPHLAQACREAHTWIATIELTQTPPYPTGLPLLEPLALAVQSVQKKLWLILEIHGFRGSDITSARLDFSFAAPLNPYCCSIQATIIASNGKALRADLPAPCGDASRLDVDST